MLLLLVLQLPLLLILATDTLYTALELPLSPSSPTFVTAPLLSHVILLVLFLSCPATVVRFSGMTMISQAINIKRMKEKYNEDGPI